MSCLSPPPCLNQSLVRKLSPGGGYSRVEQHWETAAVLFFLPLCYTEANFYISSCYTCELSCFKHIAILFRPLWEQSFPSDWISIFDSPRELSVMQQISIYSKRSNKALPLQGCYLATVWIADTILKIGFCEIMLVFVHTWHSNNASHVTVVIIKTDLNNTVISLYHMGWYMYFAWNANRLRRALVAT